MDNRQPPPYETVVGYPKGAPYPTEPISGAAPYPTGPVPGGFFYPPGFLPRGAPYPPGPTSGDPYGQPVYPPGYQSPPLSGDVPNQNETGFSNAGFNDKSIRHAFIRKVYLILTAQLLVTAVFICVFLLERSVRLWVQRNSWFYYLSYATFICTYIALVCCPGVRRRYPGNFIALGIFTLAFSYLTGTITSFYNTESVLIAVAITAALCLAISLFAIQTRIDFTKCTALLFVLSMVVLLTGLACIIVYAVTGSNNRVLQAVYGGLGALLFGLYLAFDTQMIIGGRKHELSPEEYISGALQLYMDIVNLFLMILSLFGNRD
ncbi:hypothetical protein EG68_02548 [Paragonimus skrjabini miyazakii]|uniref:Uncharacterized protein n=1 Tax=Paragonimus skrjabini miyazakii TaxID=59628 RepID=A0A8S9Z9W0_9TREM|nr:hypothetical protein EG68_02548 [Paragonimus skrjabini miyazakii]